MTVSEYNKSVDSYADNLYRFFLKNISDTELARDLVQETFAKMWLKVGDVDYEKSKSFLFTVGYNTMIDHIRKKKRSDEFIAMQKPSEYEEKDYDLKEAIDFALSKLPVIQKTVLLLRDYEGYSYEEIGQMTSLSDAQVKVYLFRARKSMKEKLLENKLLFPI